MPTPRMRMTPKRSNDRISLDFRLPGLKSNGMRQSGDRWQRQEKHKRRHGIAP